MRGIGRWAKLSRRPLPVGGHAHQPGVERVLQVAAQDAVLDQGRALGDRALVVDVERTAPAGQRTVIDDGHARGRYALADAAGVHRGALAVEIAFQAVADRFVQQHARPARSEHDRHHASRRIDRLQADQRLAQSLAGGTLRLAVGEQFGIGIAAAAAGIAGFTTAILLDEDLHVETHQRAYVSRQHAIAARDQHRIDRAGKADDHLLHAMVRSTQEGIDFAQCRNFLFRGHAFDRILRRDTTLARERLCAGRRTAGRRPC